MWYKIVIAVSTVFLILTAGKPEVIQSEKKRILIVPFDRVNFYSQIEIPIIITSNSWVSDDQVYPSYLKVLIKTLSKSTEDFSFFELPTAEATTLKMQVPVVHKMKPTSHYGVDLEKMRDTTLIQRYLKNFDADYILFLCRYEINSRLFSSSKSFDGSTFVSWSRHEIDYELFNSKEELIALAYKFPLVPKQPTDSTFLTYGVRINGMQRAYEKLQKDIIEKVQQYKDEPIYKLKRKR